MGGPLLKCVPSLPAVMVGTLGAYTTGHVLDMHTKTGAREVFDLNTFVFAAAFLAWYDSEREFE
jgi:hypothetical protein